MHLIFDFDGVIANTQTTSAKATALVNDISFEEGWTENLRYASNKPNHARGHTLSEAEVNQIYEWTNQFGNHMRRLSFELFDEFVSEIETLDIEHKAIVSSGSEQYIVPAISKTTIKPTHVLGYESHHSKEEKIELIARDWGVSLDNVYYFTDTIADVLELKDMLHGDHLIGVSWGYCGLELLSSVLDSKRILKNPSQLRSLLS